jgi:hypothetical protein
MNLNQVYPLRVKTNLRLDFFIFNISKNTMLKLVKVYIQSILYIIKNV